MNKPEYQRCDASVWKVKIGEGSMAPADAAVVI